MKPSSTASENADLSAFERRTHERKAIRRDDIPGEFTITVGGEAFSFNEVHDVSISGMGLSFQQALKEGEEVTLEYNSDSFSVSLVATVSWCEKNNHNESYRIGLRFSCGSMNDNVMFFMTLREYIDDFGEEF